MGCLDAYERYPGAGGEVTGRLAMFLTPVRCMMLIASPRRVAIMWGRTVPRMGVFGSFRNDVFGGFREWPEGAKTIAFQDQSIGAVT